MQVALKTVHGHFVTATHHDENWVLRGPRPAVNPWEVFELIRVDGPRFALKTVHGKYAIATHADENWVIRAPADTWVGWGVFEMVPVGGQIAIRTVHGHYIGATHGDENWLLVNRGSDVTPWDLLTIHEVYDVPSFESMRTLVRSQPPPTDPPLAEQQKKLQAEVDDGVTVTWEAQSTHVVVRNDEVVVDGPRTGGSVHVSGKTIQRILEKLLEWYKAASEAHARQLEREQQQANDAAARAAAKAKLDQWKDISDRVAKNREGLRENDQRNMEVERGERMSRTA